MASKIKILIVRSLAGGFRRAGIAFSEEAKRLEKDLLTEEQVKALHAEPNLAVQEVEEDAPAKEPAKDPAPEDPLKMNKEDLVAWLSKEEVTFDPNANKTDLQALAKAHLENKDSGTGGNGNDNGGDAK